MTFSRARKDVPVSLDFGMRLQQKIDQLLDEEDDDASCSTYSDDSDASTIDSEDWDSDMEELAAGLKTLLGAAKAHSTSELSQSVAQKPRSTILRSESTFVSPVMRNIVHKKVAVSTNADTSPVECLEMIVEDLGIKMNQITTIGSSYLSLDMQHLEAYPQVALAARQGDLQVLHAMYDAGISMQCSNRYGESVQHIACRRGFSDILEFLMEEAHTSIRVRDDVGRTPLHDAAWTNKPNFELVKMLLEDSPDFLFVKDKRGHLPLDYVHRDQWGPWCTFLKKNISSIKDALQSSHVCVRQ